MSMDALARKGIFDGAARSSLSPARQALHDHVNAIAVARADAEHAAIPASRLRERLRIANDQFDVAKAALDAIDASRATSMRAAAEAGDEIITVEGASRSKAEAAVAAAQRASVALRSALDSSDAEGQQARVALRDLTGYTDGFLLNVILEEFYGALEDRAAALDEFIAVETKVGALRELLGERGRGLHATGSARGIEWLRAGDKATAAWGETPRAEVTPRGVMSALACWRVALAQLSSDATAAG